MESLFSSATAASETIATDGNDAQWSLHAVPLSDVAKPPASPPGVDMC
jgi:hypothetical protein